MRDLLLLMALSSCTASTTSSGSDDAGLRDATAASPAERIDLLVVVDNSSGLQNQPLLASGLQSFAEAVFAPGDDDARERRALDLHLGVMTTDLGSSGPTSFCDVPGGDDAALNPARFGRAQRGRHGANGVRFPTSPALCSGVDAYPRWLSLDANTAASAETSLSIACKVNLGNFGCGVTQPLEALLRGATRERWEAAASMGGFLRDDALLVLLVVSTQDDLSLRPCPDSDAGATCDHDYRALNFSAARPCSPDDMTTSLTRYHDPRDARAGLLGLKPDHPERVLFMAVSGVPLGVTTSAEGEPPTWSALLGAASGSDDDFCARDGARAYTGRDEFDEVSMRPGALYANCLARVPLPACRRRSETGSISCDEVPALRAQPSRRLAEIARRFDESPLCDGRPCRNGMIFSVCADDYRPSMRALARRVRQRLAGGGEL